MRVFSLRTMLLFCPAVVGGCAMLTSDGDPSDKDVVMQYSLPMTVFSVQIVEEATSGPAAVPAGAAAFMKQLQEKGAGGAAAPADGGAAALVGPPQPEQAKYALWYSTREVADRKHTYFLRYRASAFSDDKFDITVTGEGMLNGLNATPTDRTADFVKKIGDLAVAVAQDVGAFGATFRGTPSATAKTMLNLTIDPSVCSGRLPCEPLPREAKALESYGYRIRFEPAVDVPASQPADVGAQDVCTEGICFRSKLPVRVVVEQKAAARTPLLAPSAGRSQKLAAVVRDAPAEWILEDIDFVSVANFSPVFSVAARRSLGVQRATLASISNGYLTKYDLTKNSEAIALIEVPISLAKSVAGILPALVGAQTSRESDLDKLAAARKSRFDSEQTLAAARANGQSGLQAAAADAQKTLAQKQKDAIGAQAQLQKAQLDAKNAAAAAATP